ncbi:hypothetical protein PQX77_003939 [Marasmius sp. AFHP31]|nr:hypothetical protein PQX77_003939 [Marasmius sp. AFHP31]
MSSLVVCIQLGATDAFSFLGLDFGKLAVQLGIPVAVGGTLTGTVGGSGNVSIVVILNDCLSKLSPLIEKLKGLGADDCATDKVKAIVEEIKEILVTAKGQISVLACLGVDVVLAGNAGVVISIGGCAKLCGQVAIGVFASCSSILKVAVSAELEVIKSICADLCVSVGDFLKSCCDVVSLNGGLAAVLVPVIKTSLGVCIDLGVTGFFGFLGIDFKALSTELGIQVGALSIAEALQSSDCTSNNVDAIVGQLKGIILDATAKIKLLVGADISVVLAGVDSAATVSVDACTKLIADLCTSVSLALDAVIGIVFTGEASAVFGICANLGICIGGFIHACDGCVVCIKLAITASFDFLGVNFVQIAASAGLSLGGLLETILSGGLKLGSGLKLGFGLHL